MKRSVARRRLKSDKDWNTFLETVRSLPDRERVWVKAACWRLMNWTQGQQTGPTFESIDLSIKAKDLLQRSNSGKVLRDALRGVACDANTKALLVEYRYYFLDTKLQKELHAREFADRLLRSAKHLLDLYRWFGGTARRRLR